MADIGIDSSWIPALASEATGDNNQLTLNDIRRIISTALANKLGGQAQPAVGGPEERIMSGVVDEAPTSFLGKAWGQVSPNIQNVLKGGAALFPVAANTTMPGVSAAVSALNPQNPLQRLESVIQGAKAVPGAAADVARGAGNVAADVVEGAANLAGQGGSPTLGDLGMNVANAIRPSEPEPAPTQPVISSLAQVADQPATTAPAASPTAPAEPGWNRDDMKRVYLGAAMAESDAAKRAAAEQAAAARQEQQNKFIMDLVGGGNQQPQKPNKMSTIGNMISNAGLAMLAAGGNDYTRPQYIRDMQNLQSQGQQALQNKAALAQQDLQNRRSAALQMLGWNQKNQQQAQSEAAAQKRTETTVSGQVEREKLRGENQRKVAEIRNQARTGQLNQAQWLRLVNDARGMGDDAMVSALMDVGSENGWNLNLQQGQAQSAGNGSVIMTDPKGQRVQVPAGRVQELKQKGYQ